MGKYKFVFCVLWEIELFLKMGKNKNRFFVFLWEIKLLTKIWEKIKIPNFVFCTKSIYFSNSDKIRLCQFRQKRIL